MNYLKKTYFVTMTTFQMAVLLAFNGSDSQTVTELLASTSLQEPELVKQIQTIVDAKILATQVCSGVRGWGDGA